MMWSLKLTSVAELLQQTLYSEERIKLDTLDFRTALIVNGIELHHKTCNNKKNIKKKRRMECTFKNCFNYIVVLTNKIREMEYCKF